MVTDDPLQAMELSSSNVLSLFIITRRSQEKALDLQRGVHLIDVSKDFASEAIEYVKAKKLSKIGAQIILCISPDEPKVVELK